MTHHLNCASCGIAFCITDDFERRRREDHKGFFCPSGHSNHYPQKTEVEKLQATIKHLRNEIEVIAEISRDRMLDIEHLRRSRGHWKGVVTRLKAAHEGS